MLTSLWFLVISNSYFFRVSFFCPSFPFFATINIENRRHSEETHNVNFSFNVFSRRLQGLSWKGKNEMTEKRGRLWNFSLFFFGIRMTHLATIRNYLACFFVVWRSSLCVFFVYGEKVNPWRTTEKLKQCFNMFQTEWENRKSLSTKNKFVQCFVANFVHNFMVCNSWIVIMAQWVLVNGEWWQWISITISDEWKRNKWKTNESFTDCSSNWKILKQPKRAFWTLLLSSDVCEVFLVFFYDCRG